MACDSERKAIDFRDYGLPTTSHLPDAVLRMGSWALQILLYQLVFSIWSLNSISSYLMDIWRCVNEYGNLTYASKDTRYDSQAILS